MKLLLKLALLPVLLFVLLVVGVAVLLDPAAVKAVSGGVSAATGCEAELGSADIGLLDGHVKFDELEVQNPPGFREGPVLSLGHFEANWDTASWSALKVQMSDQHYFVYSFDSAGNLGAAEFTANAHADLDCDGLQSTFQRLGFGDPEANKGECAMYGSPAFYVDNETE